ncbi:hypothetical protein EYE35_01070 [Cereibacter sphaeroides]|nr:hypothetical protein EYE35_01070 [Cereibacter sphaeroides]
MRLLAGHRKPMNGRALIGHGLERREQTEEPPPAAAAPAVSGSTISGAPNIPAPTVVGSTITT